MTMRPEAGHRPQPPLVLIANDQEWASRSLESLLGPRGFASVRAYTGRQALELLRSTRPDAVVLDVSLPDVSGVELCRGLRETAGLPAGTPIILLTAGTPTRNERLEAYRAGAWELLSEPFDAETLLLKLELFVNAKRQAEQQLDAGLTDAHTAVYNSHGLARRAREVGADVTRRKEPVSCVALLAYVDGDQSADPTADFGARAAERVADACRTLSRAGDVVARIGRTEFALVAPASDEDGARRLVERIRESVERVPLRVGSEERSVRLRHAAISVADYSTASADLVSLVLRAAGELRVARSTPPALVTFESSGQAS